MASQGLSSATNFGLTLALALSITADRLGRTVSVYAVYLLALTLSRALTTDVLVAASDGNRMIDLPWLWAKRRIVALGAAASLTTASIGLITGAGPTATVLFGLSVPMLLIQDGLRSLAWADGRPGLAALLDTVWFAVSAAGLIGAVALTDDLEATSIILVWCIGGLASWLVGWRLVEPACSGEAMAGFQPDLLRYRPLAHSQAVMAAAVNIGPIVVLLAVSPATAGVAKAALLPITPVLSLFSGLRVVTLPTLRRAIDNGNGPGAISLLIAGSAVISAAGGLTAIEFVRAVPPDRLGESLLLVVPHLGWVGLVCIMYVVGQQLADATALADRHGVLSRRVFGIAAEWGLLIAGASIGGVEGLIIGWTIGLAIATVAWLQPALMS